MKFFEVFPRDGIVILPVIHLLSLSMTFENIRIAMGEGAHGVFLIDHSADTEFLCQIYKQVRDKHPELWIGLNPLGLPPAMALGLAMEDVSGLKGVSGIWTDYSGVPAVTTDEAIVEAQITVTRDSVECLYFGGVAFKGQRPVRDEDLPSVAQEATHFMDVVTTSGPGTGRSADPEKIHVMRKAIGDFPLALASGVTPDNLSMYSEVNCVLVSTGICVSGDFYTFDQAKLRALIREAQGL